MVIEAANHSSVRELRAGYQVVFETVSERKKYNSWSFIFPISHVLSAICDRHPDIQIEQYLVLDVIIGHAVRQGWLEKSPERADKYDQEKEKAWHSFYESSPYLCAGYIVKAFRFLTEAGKDLTAAYSGFQINKPLLPRNKRFILLAPPM